MTSVLKYRTVILIILCILLMIALLVTVNHDKCITTNFTREHFTSQGWTYTAKQNNIDSQLNKNGDINTINITHESNTIKHFTNSLPLGAPSNVVYIWCKKKIFTFRNYLSVTSVIKFVHPPVITFVYEDYPLQDKANYNTWLQQIRDQFPFWLEYKHKKHKNGKRSFCSAGGNEVSREAVADVVQKFNLSSGQGSSVLYVSSNTVFTEPFQAVHSNNKSIRIMKTIRGYFLFSANGNETIVACVQVDHNTYLPSVSNSCVQLKSELHPENIIDNNSSTAAILRQVFYGDKRIPMPEMDTNTKAPNIAHYVWLGGGEMNVTFYISILSVLFIAKIDHIYIHGDKPPRGPNWGEVSSTYRHQVHRVVRYRPPGIFNQTISVLAHLADVIKSDIMYKYGGIMLDPDILFIRPIDPILYHYEAVISLDLANNSPFPDMFNMGISISKPRSRFAQMWIESERSFVDKDWLWNCGAVTYKLWERNPRIALISRQLQLMCFRHKCHPFWVPRRVYRVIKSSLKSSSNN